MPVVRMKWVSRQMLRVHPDWLFLFGDNEARCGFGGQALEMRGEPNACGVRTKRYPSAAPTSYWTDIRDFELHLAMIAADLERPLTHHRAGGIVVIPEMGLGTNRSRLADLAPRTFDYLNERLKEFDGDQDVP